MIHRRDALTAFAAFGGVAFGTLLPTPARAHHSGAVIGDDDRVLGDAAAPITVIEYASMTCPHCAKFHAETLPLIKKNYIDTGKVRLAMRHFPFDRPALLAAALAECSGSDERYFTFVNALYSAQQSWARVADPVAALTSFGRLGGLKADAIKACFDDKALLDRILANRVNGSKEFGIDSTPSFIINGEKFVGNLPYGQFVDIFERLLSNS